MNGRDILMSWLARARSGHGPAYLRIADALEAAVAAGELQPGDRLPPQRAVAERLEVDLTTVTRAYAEAQRRGLLDAAVGRGTFVRPPDDPGRVDLTMNLPPPPEGLSLGALIAETAAAVLGRTDPDLLLAYHPEGGSNGQRLAGAAWLTPVLGMRPVEQVLIAPGAQAALAATLSTLCRPGDAVLVEPLTYPGLLGLCGQLGLRAVACGVDGDGLSPASVIETAARTRSRALYVVPSLSNPTARTLAPSRRAALAEAAARAGLWIVEDDPYSRLLEAPPQAIAALAPERTVHIATLAKALTPGLRIAYVAVPPGETGQKLAAALRALAQMPAPLMAAVATTWIREGRAETVLAAVRAEARVRRQIAAERLPQGGGEAESLHVWVPAPTDFPVEAVRRAALARGMALATSDLFAAGPQAPAGLRVSLGGPIRRNALAEALDSVRALLDAPDFDASPFQAAAAAPQP